MKNKLYFMALLLVFPVFSFAQKLSDDFITTTSTPYGVIDASSKEYAAIDDAVIMAKMRKNIVTLQRFDINEMKEVARKTYEDFPKKVKFLKLLKMNKNLFYLYEIYNKKTKNFEIYSRKINTDDATFEAPVKLLTTSRKVVKSKKIGLSDVTSLGIRVGGPRFIIHQSFDNSKIMIQYRLIPLNKSDKTNYDDIGLFVFDNNMEKIWGKEVKMPHTEAQMDNIAYAISNSGKALILATNNEKKTYELITVTGDNDVQTFDLGISTKKLVRKMLIKESKDGNFICAGYYANGIEFKFNVLSGGAFVFNVNGLMYLKISDEGEVLMNKTFDFSKEFIQQNLTARQKKAVAKREEKGKAGILDLVLLNFEVKPDGSALILGERQYVRSEMVGPQQQTVYHFSNIIAMKVDPNGELAWMKKLPKNQKGFKGTGQMSYKYMEGTNDYDYIAYLDNPKNIALGTSEVPKAHVDGMGGFLTTYKIDLQDGSLEKHTIFDMKDIKGIRAYQFSLSRIISAGNGVFLMEAYIKKKKDMMVKFELKK